MYLVLDRHKAESINIGDDIEVKILMINKYKVRIGFYAPKDIPIHRNEIYRKIQAEKRKKQQLEMQPKEAENGGCK
jgi:carbon storage regulator